MIELRNYGAYIIMKEINKLGILIGILTLLGMEELGSDLITICSILLSVS